MNSSPENQFKKFLIAIVVVATVIIASILRPSFFDDFKNSSGLKLSSDKPWKEVSSEEEVIDDLDIQFAYPENEFKKESSNNPFKKDDLEEDSDITGVVAINPMSDLNGKTKVALYEQRKLFVEKSIFKSRRYKPSEAVFGQMVDGKPWLGIEALTCTGSGPNANKGFSEESRYINNPTVLIGLDRINFDEKPKNQCKPVDYLMPTKITYSKEDNLITVLFDVSSYKGDLGKTFLLKGLNARDLGYKFAYADVVNNLTFIQQDKNISTDIHEFKDFIQLGSVCGVKGGCNNGSPFQKELNYTVMKYPASMHFKLWRKSPKNKNAKEDINYLIILR